MDPPENYELEVKNQPCSHVGDTDRHLICLNLSMTLFNCIQYYRLRSYEIGIVTYML